MKICELPILARIDPKTQKHMRQQKNVVAGKNLPYVLGMLGPLFKRMHLTYILVYSELSKLSAYHCLFIPLVIVICPNIQNEKYLEYLAQFLAPP